MGQALFEAVLQLLGGIVQPRRPTRLGLALTAGPRWRRVAAFILIITVVPAIVSALLFGTFALIGAAF
jgi:hypothetical protein